jgi:hypothetical protein
MGRVEAYLSNYPNPGTHQNYRKFISIFLGLAGRPSDAELETKAEAYFSQKQDYAQDVERFFQLSRLAVKGDTANNMNNR